MQEDPEKRQPQITMPSETAEHSILKLVVIKMDTEIAPKMSKWSKPFDMTSHWKTLEDYTPLAVANSRARKTLRVSTTATKAQIPAVSSKEGAVIDAVLITRKFHRGHH
jgi:hypothetical protein